MKAGDSLPMFLLKRGGFWPKTSTSNKFSKRICFLGNLTFSYTNISVDFIFLSIY